MSDPTAFLVALRSSTSDLVKGLTDLHWSEGDVAAPSLCAGWTRGHVLTHIARNADGICNTLAGALRGEIVARYPAGMAARNAAIEEGAARPYAELVADVRDTAERLDRMFGAIGDADGWGLRTENEDEAASWVLRRWREVEIHRVDLAADYTPERWPPRFVSEVLSDAVGSLGARVEGAVRVTITDHGCVAPDLVGKEWTAGDGTPVEVRGPDWAVLAWLVGRASIASDALSATPPLGKWR